MRRQREWLRVTLSSIGDAVIATDAEGRITFVNPVAESLTGWKAEEAAGQRVQCVFQIVNEETGHALEDPVARVLRERRRRIGEPRGAGDQGRPDRARRG